MTSNLPSSNRATRAACALVFACATLAAACGGSSDPTPSDVAEPGSPEQIDSGAVVDTTATVKCSQGPQGGEPCGAEPPETLCRQRSCVGGCELSCACCQGLWVCSTTCVDSYRLDAEAADQPPLCRAPEAVEMICLHAAP